MEIVGSNPMAFAKNIYAAFASYFDLGLKYSSQVLFYMFFIWAVRCDGLTFLVCTETKGFDSHMVQNSLKVLVSEVLELIS